MIAEGAILGVPGIYIDNTGRYYTKELSEKYGLVFNFTESAEDQERAIHQGIKILNSKPNLNDNKEKLLADKIDVTGFLVWFVENYPKSAKILKKDPNYTSRFKWIY